jgi:hypothetical protein
VVDEELFIFLSRALNDAVRGCGQAFEEGEEVQCRGGDALEASVSDASRAAMRIAARPA